MKKLISISAIFCSSILSMQAQNEIDALRYSQSYYGGTARSSAMAGAFGALGADFSSLSTNPAGIGLYKKSEFTLTPSINGMHTNSTYLGNDNSDYRYNLGFNNLGMVFTSKTSKSTQEKGWMNVQFGFGMNKTNIYNSRVWIEGDNYKNSILDVYWNEAQGKTPAELSDYDTYLAFDTYLLDTIGSEFINASVYTPGGLRQTKYYTTKGATNEMVFTFGGNFKDKIYIGATIGVPYVRYTESSTYEETEINDSTDFISMKIRDEMSTTGNGLNFKFGLIYRPTDWLRVGGSFHSPTFYSLQNVFSRTMISNFEGINQEFKSESPENTFDYTLLSPMRATGSLGFIFGTTGLISVDYEYVNYPEARLNSESNHFSEVNDAIELTYRTQTNLRVGGELRLDPVTLRAGYANYGSPFHSSVNDASKKSYSFGFGFRDEDYFLDFAYVMSVQKEDYYLYPLADIEPAKVKSVNNQFLCTLGFKF